MRVGFVTAVELGRACIEEILACGGALDLVVTLRDEQATGKSGRARLDDLCSAAAIPLVKVRNINDCEAVQALRAARLDWLFIVGWSQIAQPEVLETAVRGVLGIHPTLLPEGRGRAPIPWAILKDLPQTGVTMFRLDAGVDSGPIAGQLAIPLDPRETASSLYDKVVAGHRSLIRDCWPRLVTDALQFMQQDETRATYWPARRPEDGAIDLTGSVLEADRLVRAVTRPYPGAFLDSGDTRYRLWSAEFRAPSGRDIGVYLDGSRLEVVFRDGDMLATVWDSAPRTA